MIQEYKVSIGRACKVVDLARSMFYYKHQKDDTEVINKLEVLVKEYQQEGLTTILEGSGTKDIRGIINGYGGFTG